MATSSFISSADLELLSHQMAQQSLTSQPGGQTTTNYNPYFSSHMNGAQLSQRPSDPAAYACGHTFEAMRQWRQIYQQPERPYDCNVRCEGCHGASSSSSQTSTSDDDLETDEGFDEPGLSPYELARRELAYRRSTDFTSRARVKRDVRARKRDRR